MSGVDVEQGHRKGKSHISLTRMENTEEKHRSHRHPAPQNDQSVKYSKHLEDGDEGGDLGGDGGDPAVKTATPEINEQPLENNDLSPWGGDGGDLLQPHSTSDDTASVDTELDDEDVEWSA